MTWFRSLVVFALTVAPVEAATITHVADILANPAKFDGQHVSVVGTVTDLEEKTSHAGNAYDVFSVCDHGSCIHAFIFGRPAIAEGKQVTAAGTFAAVKHAGSYTFRNEIDLDEGSL